MDSRGSEVCFIGSSTGRPRIVKMARALSQRGVRVTILEWDRTAVLPKEEHVDGVRIVRLGLRANFGFTAILKLPFWVFYVMTFIAKNRFEVVQAQNFDNLVPSLLLRPLFHYRVVYDLADFYSDAHLFDHRRVAKLVRQLERGAIKNTDAMIMASEGQVSQVIQSNVPNRTTVVHNVPTDEELELASDPNQTPGYGETLLLFYGGVLSRDRIPLLANLIAVVESMDCLTLRIAGYGEGERLLNREFRNVHYLGRLPHMEILHETRHCDCVVIPFDSDLLNNKIGLPNKLFEALAQGKPALTQRGTLAARIIIDFQCGFATDFKSIEQIRLTLDQIFENRAALERMGAEARKLFERRYMWSFSEERFLAIYRELGMSVSK